MAMAAVCFLCARLQNTTMSLILQFFMNVLLQLDEFVSRLKETKLGHRHFYEVHFVVVFQCSNLRLLHRSYATAMHATLTWTLSLRGLSTLAWTEIQ